MNSLTQNHVRPNFSILFHKYDILFYPFKINFRQFCLFSVLFRPRTNTFLDSLNIQNELRDCNPVNYNCSQNALCQETKDEFACTCKPGFIGDGKTCKCNISIYCDKNKIQVKNVARNGNSLDLMD